MYTRPGQQGDEELARMRRERACTCGHSIWTHAFMERLNHRRCNVDACTCADYAEAGRPIS